MVPRSSRSYIFLIGLFSFLILSAFSSFAGSQTYPSKIRGYKVHKAEVSVFADPKKASESDLGVLVKFEDPIVSGVSLTGVTFSVRASITSFGQSGNIDFVAFEDFKINGTPVKIEELTESFTFSKGDAIALQSPVKIFINGIEGAKVLAQEVRGLNDQWRITGTAFVFGKFKKGPFKFKRVIPVNVDLTIAKPSIKIPYITS